MHALFGPNMLGMILAVVQNFVHKRVVIMYK